MLNRLIACAALALLPFSAFAQPTSSGLAPSAAGKSLAVTTSSSCVAMTQQNNSIVVWNVGAAAAYYNVNGATATTGNPQLPSGAAISLSIPVGASLCAITASGSTTLQITQGFGAASLGWAGAAGSGGGTAVTIADGADVAEGAVADAAASAGGTGTVSAKLRLMTTQLGTINTTLGTPMQATGGTVAATQSGTWTVQPGNTANTTAWLVNTADLCQGVKSSVAISQTASTVLVSASASNRIYVCSFALIAGGAEIVSLVQGTGSTCGTSTDAIIGATTAANGLSLAANGGLTFGNGLGTVARGPNTNEDVCLLQDGSDRIAGVMTYVLAP